jgi:hypothetical protein
VILLNACGRSGAGSARTIANIEAEQFLAMYNEVYQRLETVAAEANWRASTDVNEQH